MKTTTNKQWVVKRKRFFVLGEKKGNMFTHAQRRNKKIRGRQANGLVAWFSARDTRKKMDKRKTYMEKKKIKKKIYRPNSGVWE